MKLAPQSMAEWSAARDSVSSTLPQVPPIAHAPKLMSETFQPVRPKSRSFMSYKIARLVGQADPEGTPPTAQGRIKSWQAKARNLQYYSICAEPTGRHKCRCRIFMHLHIERNGQPAQTGHFRAKRLFLQVPRKRLPHQRDPRNTSPGPIMSACESFAQASWRRRRCWHRWKAR